MAPGVVPKIRRAVRAASHGGVLLGLAGVYALLLGGALASGGAAGGLDFDGLRVTLATPLGFLAGWTHYLAFDLFVGAWIVREALRLDLEPRPALLFALFVGPIGLAAFLLQRGLRLRSLGQIGEGDLA